VKEWLVYLTEQAIVILDFIALLVVAYGSADAFVNTIRLVIGPPDEQARRHVWLRYARWLVAALTFQLAADIVETSITTSWDVVGRIAAIAVIRTFLNYFLDRDLADVRERQHPRPDEANG
jgi:uncharacterized membrane protein